MSDQHDLNGEPIAEEDFTEESVGPVGAAAGAMPAEAGGPTGGPAGGVAAALASPYSPELGVIEKHREGTRRWLAYGLVMLLAAVALISLAAVVFKWQTTDEVKSIADVIYPPIVALTGSALGFFFGVERGSAQ